MKEWACKLPASHIPMIGSMSDCRKVLIILPVLQILIGWGSPFSLSAAIPSAAAGGFAAEIVKMAAGDCEKSPAAHGCCKAVILWVIPIRRVKSISKLFCIEDLIRRGFI